MLVSRNANEREKRGPMTHATVKSALEQEFEDACMSDVEECSKLGYYPHYFVQKMDPPPPPDP
jgi:hypothetical protein